MYSELLISEEECAATPADMHNKEVLDEFMRRTAKLPVEDIKKITALLEYYERCFISKQASDTGRPGYPGTDEQGAGANIGPAAQACK